MPRNVKPLTMAGARNLLSVLGKVRTSVFLDSRFPHKDRDEVVKAIDTIIRLTVPLTVK